MHIDFEPTPNPNSLKFTASGRVFIPSGMETFGTPAEATGHTLGEALFGVEGVANVFILPQFLTVTKRPEADWDEMLPQIEDILAAHFEVGEGG